MQFPTGPLVPGFRRVKAGFRRTRTAVRLEAYLMTPARRKGGGWMPCPSYKKLANYLQISVSTLSRAFRELEEAGWCRLKFRSGFTGPGGTRQKLMALKTWLRHDGEPLLRRADGRSRGIRESFRRGAARLETTGAKHRQPEQNSTPKRGGGNFDFSGAVSFKKRTTSAVDNPPATAPRPAATPPAGLSVSGKSLEGTAWRMARAALADGEICWHGCAVEIPVATLRTLLLPAVRRGLDWTAIRRALRRAVHAAHDATRCSARPILNPGAFAAAVFRDALGLRRSTRRQPAGRPRTSATPPPPSATKPAPKPAPVVRTLSPEEIAAGQRQRLELAAMLRAALNG